MKGFPGLCQKSQRHRRHAFRCSLFLHRCIGKFIQGLPFAEGKVVTCLLIQALLSKPSRSPLITSTFPVADPLCPQDHEGVVKDEYTHLNLRRNGSRPNLLSQPLKLSVANRQNLPLVARCWIKWPPMLPCRHGRRKV